MYIEHDRSHGYMACPTQRCRACCDQRAVRSTKMEDQVERWLTSLTVPADWRDDIERMHHGLMAPERPRSSVDRAAVAGQLERLPEPTFWAISPARNTLGGSARWRHHSRLESRPFVL
jgi:hypothetical protein